MADPFGSGFNEKFRFGSSSWAQEDDLRRARLLGNTGTQIGFYNDLPVRLESDSPITLIGGAGSGKLRDFLAYIAADCKGRNSLWNDPKGEFYTGFSHNHELDGDKDFAYNPFGLLLGHIPQHRINPLDILEPDSPNLQANALLIARSLITASKGENAFFGLRAQEWFAGLMETLTLKDGGVSFKTLVEAVNSIQGNPIKFAELLEFMHESRFAHLQRLAGEIVSMMESNQKMLGSILGEIYGQCAWFNLPNVVDSLSDPDMSLADYCDTEGLHVYLIVPAQQQQIMAPVLRVMMQVAMLYKSRRADAPRLNIYVDEAAQLGKAEFLIQAYTYGRGIGVRTLSVWQDLGQIKSIHGEHALTTILGSSEARIFFGIRDFDTAKYVSDSLGYETLEFDDEIKQSEARNQKMKAMHEALLHGQDMLANAKTYVHFHEQEQHRTKQTRLLMTPSEILSMPEDRMIGFVSGRNLQPIYLEKYPYFTRPEMEGYWKPNPYY